MGLGEGIVREFGKVVCILLCSKQITKDLRYSTGNSAQCYGLVLLAAVSLQCITPQDLVTL